MPRAVKPEDRKYKERKDKGSRKSPWGSRPCETCGCSVVRRESEYRDRVYCSLACSKVGASASAKARQAEGRPVGRPRRSTLTVETVDGTKPAWLADGYVIVDWPEHPAASKTGRILEHRLVMEAHIGRQLLAAENVHHMNGVRNDNRIENLELWNKAQPAGQRPEDLLAYADEIIALYRPAP